MFQLGLKNGRKKLSKRALYWVTYDDKKGTPYVSTLTSTIEKNIYSSNSINWIYCIWHCTYIIIQPSRAHFTLRRHQKWTENFWREIWKRAAQHSCIWKGHRAELGKGWWDHPVKRGSCNIVSYDIFFFFSEADILEHEEQFEPFYSSFVALAAHYLSHSLTAGKYTLV